jgi:hypothetical protein
MRLSVAIRVALLASLVLASLANVGTATAQRPLPNPVLVFTGQDSFVENGKQMTRYRFAVDNRADYPDELFAASPDLPPCGNNTKASRTWVDLYAQDGKRLYGFCAFGSSKDLSQIWFALDSSVVPPSWIYIELTDRKTNTKYKSNLADTTL